MGWGVPRRPKISNKLGIPHRSEGSDGDIQVRQTGLGARLFAKLGGRWLSSLLSDESKFPSGSIFFPKVWSIDGTFAATMPTNTDVELPSFLNKENILYVACMIQFRATDEWITTKHGGLNSEIVINAFFQDIDVEVAYRENQHDIRFASSSDATKLAGEKYRLTIFFK